MALAAETEEDLQAVEQLLNERENAGKGEITPPRIVSTLGEVAKVVGVELGTVRDWRTGADRMPGEEGAYDLVDILLWRCERLKKNAGNAKSPELLEVELQIKQEDRKKRQIANWINEKSVVDRTEVEKKVLEMFNDSRTLIEAIPADIGPLIPPELRNEIMQKIGQQIALNLRKMAQKASQCLE